MDLRCRIPGCTSQSKCHRLPKNDFLRSQWLLLINDENLKGLALCNIPSNVAVCKDHFLPIDFFSPARLKPGAIPSQNLPSVDYDSDLDKSDISLQVEDDSKIPLSFAETTSPIKYYTNPFKCRTRPLGSHQSLSTEETSMMTQSSSSSSFINFLKDPTPENTIAEVIPVIPNAQFRKRYLRSKRNTKRKNYKMAKSFVTSKAFHKVTKELSSHQKRDFRDQLLSYFKQRKLTGCRYMNIEEEVALSIYKRSRKVYRFLTNFFYMPSVQTLQRLISTVPLVTGFSPVIFSSLKKIALRMCKRGKYFSLLWDEMSLVPHLDYNAETDLIEGFEDFQNIRSKRIADRVLVFMIKSLSGLRKLPVAYYFCESRMKSPQLVRCIKEVYKALDSTGLKIIATVCDHSANNQAAINILRKNTAQFRLANSHERSTIEIIPGKEIVVLFDVPHLFKAIRNNLLTKDLEFYDDNSIKRYASWKHIIGLYEMEMELDKDIEMWRLLPHINESHIFANKMNKTNVSHCAKVLSQRLGCIVFHTEYTGLPAEAKYTGKNLLFWDQLFDSVNGTSRCYVSGKNRKVCMYTNSFHRAFWTSAIKKIRLMRFVDTYTKQPTSAVSCLKSWIVTLEGFLMLWDMLKDSDFLYLGPRHVNLDPLENFFDGIKSHNVLNTNPTPYQFSASFKSLLINRLVSNRTHKKKCEDDGALFFFIDLLAFIQKNNLNRQHCVDETEDTAVVKNPSRYRFTLSDEKVYTAGFIISKILSSSPCKECRRTLTSEHAKMHGFVVSSEYSKEKKLRYASVRMIQCFNATRSLIRSFLADHAYSRNIRQKLSEKIRNTVDFTVFTCTLHRDTVINNYIEAMLTLQIQFFINNTNKLLNGKLQYHGSNAIFSYAVSKYQNRFKRK